MSLCIDFFPIEKKNLGISVHSVTFCIPRKLSRAVIGSTNNLALFQEGRMAQRLTRISQPIFQQE
jgi:hypothetical protein